MVDEDDDNAIIVPPVTATITRQESNEVRVAISLLVYTQSMLLLPISSGIVVLPRRLASRVIDDRYAHCRVCTTIISFLFSRYSPHRWFVRVVRWSA